VAVSIEEEKEGEPELKAKAPSKEALKEALEASEQVIRVYRLLQLYCEGHN